MTDEEIPQAHKDAERRAALFDAMATQIWLNKDAKFGGAFLMVPPDTEDVYSQLTLNHAEAGIFWAAVKTLAEVAVNAIDMVQRRQGFR